MGEVIKPTHVAIEYNEAQKLHDHILKYMLFFEARDEMNSYVHLSEVRSSPITELAQIDFNKLATILIESHG